MTDSWPTRPLTPAEERLVPGLLRQHTAAQIAADFGLSERTVEAHFARIFDLFPPRNDHEAELSHRQRAVEWLLSRDTAHRDTGNAA